MAPKKSSGLHAKGNKGGGGFSAGTKATAPAKKEQTPAASTAHHADPAAPAPAKEEPAKPQAPKQKEAVKLHSNKKEGKGSSLANAAKSLPKKGKEQSQIGFVPPGALLGSSKDKRNHFEATFEPHFQVPARIATAPVQLVEAVNDFHFAMMNDVPRNEFYYNMLKQHIVPGKTTVLEIGAGSGLLSMMAAKLGAKWVVAVEGSYEMSKLAANNVKKNKLEEIVKVHNMMSTDLELEHLPGKPDLLVSEIFGTLLLGESAHDYIADIRERILLAEDPTAEDDDEAEEKDEDDGEDVIGGGEECLILPQYGTQYAVLIECPTLDSICAVGSWNGLDLSEVNALRDTASTVFTKKYGFRMSSVEYKELSKPIPLADLDFTTFDPDEPILPCKTMEVEAIESGTAHAVMYYWVAEHPGVGAEATKRDVHVMSTDPKDTLNNFPRDMQWGQALQLLDASEEDHTDSRPEYLTMSKGEKYNVRCRRSNDNVLMQFDVNGANKKQ